MSLDPALLVERHVAEWLRAQAIIPGVEVHHDPDVTWVVHPGRAWSNAGILIRFSADSAGSRLDTLLDRYRAHRRGIGLWVSPAATPGNLPALLAARRLHCRKRFPAMVRDLDVVTPARPVPPDIDIRPVSDPAQFQTTPHPSIGPITTPLRRFALDSLRALLLGNPARCRGFVAWSGEMAVGATLVFAGTECAGLHDVDVVEAYRGRGIGVALVNHACQHAAGLGASTMVLLATSDGQRVYERCGFSEVARFGYWYRSFQRPADMTHLIHSIWKDA
jgi:GNAT superfamily N-acetyltransferase